MSSRSNNQGGDLAGWNRVIQGMNERAANAGKMPAEPKAPRYTVEPPTRKVPRNGRLLKDGKPWIGAEAVYGADTPGGMAKVLARIADLLNQHGEG